VRIFAFSELSELPIGSTAGAADMPAGNLSPSAVHPPMTGKTWWMDVLPEG